MRLRISDEGDWAKHVGCGMERHLIVQCLQLVFLLQEFDVTSAISTMREPRSLAYVHVKMDAGRKGVIRVGMMLDRGRPKQRE